MEEAAEADEADEAEGEEGAEEAEKAGSDRHERARALILLQTEDSHCRRRRRHLITLLLQPLLACFLGSLFRLEAQRI